MIVRDAKGADFQSLLSLGEKFYSTTKYVDVAPYAWDTAAVLFDLLLREGVFLVAENSDGLIVGMVGLLVLPFMFNAGALSAHEIVWYVDPAERSRGAGMALLKAVEPACRERGADMIQMMHLSTSNDATGRVYERMGFRHSESSYMKVI